MSPFAIARAGRAAGLVLLTALGSCRDLPTQAGPDISGIAPGDPTRTFVAGSYFGIRNSPANASYDGVIDSWDGSAPTKPEPTGVYHYPTIVAVTVAGTLYQVPGDINRSGEWGPLGLADHQAAIGAVISTGNGSAIYWPATTNSDTVRVSGTVHGLRAGFNDPQPEGDWWWTCGKFVSARDGVRKPCWTFQGAASLSLARVPVDLTLALSMPDSVDVGTEITFTAGATRTTIAGKLVDISALEWRWEPDLTGTADTTACTQSSGASCTRTLSGPGTMHVTAYVNGQQQQKSQQVGVVGKNPGPRTCLTKQPELDSPDMQVLLKKLWADSKPDGDHKDRREQGGYITLNNGQYNFIPFEKMKPSTPCSIYYWLAVPLPQGTVAMIHTHPYGNGEPMPMCPGKDSKGNTYIAQYTTGLSSKDVKTALNHSKPEYIMDRDKFVKYDSTGELGRFDHCLTIR